MAEERDTLPCPGCHTPLPPEATGCQICLRGRTKQEIVRGYAKLRAEKARKRRRPFQILAAVLVLGAGGKLVMTHRDKLSSAAGAASRWLDDMRDPRYYAPKPGGPASPPSDDPAAVPGAPAAPEDALRAQLMPPDVPPAGGAPEQGEAPPAARPAGPKPLAENAWRVSGVVYDLATLDPVPRAEITFLRDEKEPATATTNDKGEYEIDLVKGGGWTASMKSPKHRPGQVLDIDPPYRVRDADERRAAMEALTDGDLIPAPVDWKRASSKVRLDLVAVPSRWSDASRP